MTSYSQLLTDRRALVRHSLKVLAAAVMIVPVAFFFLDQNIALYFNDESRMPLKRFAHQVTDIGLGENFFVLSLVLFGIFYWLDKRATTSDESPTKWRWLKTWSVDAFLALIFAGLTNEIIKVSVGRQRPFVSDTFEAHIFSHFNLNPHFQSFPSGHSQVLFCVATMLAILWPRWTPWIYLIAVALAATRVIVQAHFLSDITMGATVGHLATLWGLWLLQKYFPKRFSLLNR